MVGAGRHPDSEIFLDDVTVSRRHAEFRRSGTGYTVGDVGSLNGTYVNRDRIDSVELNDGDEVQIGKYLPGVLLLAPGQLIRWVPRRPRDPTAAPGSTSVRCSTSCAPTSPG